MTDVLVADEQPPGFKPAGEPSPAGLPASATPQPPQVFVSNDLPCKLVVPGREGRMLVLSPLETHPLPADDRETFAESLAKLEDRGCVTVETTPPSPTLNSGLVLLGIVTWAALGFFVAGAFYGGVLYWSIGLAAIAVLTIVIARKLSDPRQLTREQGTLWLQRLFWPLLVVLVVGVTVPAASVYFGGGLHEAVDLITGSDQDELAYLTLIGRGLQALLISIVSLLPALLYFLFDRMKVETLRRGFEQDIFRFDPTMRTRSDVRARYGTLMDELYGRDDRAIRRIEPAAAGAPQAAAAAAPARSSRVLPGRLAPVWVATVVITSGWILSLLNPDVAAPLQGSQQVVLLFEPQRSPVVFGFLGAYVFALQSLLRSYLRADLRPKSYSHITVRIIVAVIFAWVLELLFSSTASPLSTTTDDVLLVLAFVVGILPETLLVRLQESVRHLVGGRRLDWMPTLYEQYPLNRLEGIDIYDRSRLIDEGVGNIEGLAHHYLPELMMQTRIPVARLVYWTDQAILYLHVVCAADSAESQNGTNEGESRLRVLQTHGIQTATDLESAYRAAVDRDGKKQGAGGNGAGGRAAGDVQEGDSEAAAFLSLLDDEEDDGDGRLPRLRVILDSIGDEEWMPNLQYWHDECHRARQTLTLTDDGKLVPTDDPAQPQTRSG
jgi:hypothetical protein